MVKITIESPATHETSTTTGYFVDSSVAIFITHPLENLAARKSLSRESCYKNEESTATAMEMVSLQQWKEFSYNYTSVTK